MRQQKGFTLLEVMVATVILGVGLAAISGSVATAVRSAALASGYEQARQIAESRLALFLATQPTSGEQMSGEDGVVSAAEVPVRADGVVRKRLWHAGGDQPQQRAQGA